MPSSYVSITYPSPTVAAMSAKDATVSAKDATMSTKDATMSAKDATMSADDASICAMDNFMEPSKHFSDVGTRNLQKRSVNRIFERFYPSEKGPT